MRLLLPNFQFEDALRTPSFRPSRQTVMALEDLACTMAVLAEPGDGLLLPTDQRPAGLPDWARHTDFVPSSAHPATGALVPWGWTPDCRHLHDGSSPLPPDQTCVQRVNSREFLAKRDRVWSASAGWHSRPFGVFCRDLLQWEQAIRQMELDGHERWCVKPQWSHAGRNRLLGSGVLLNEQQRGWLNRHLPVGVYVEPWLDVRQEWSLHFDVLPDGHAALVGVTELLNDGMGRYAGNLITTTRELGLSDELCAQAERLAVECGAAGYHGPLGLDGFRFGDANGNAGIRICNDINARYSMGRLALAACRLCQPGDRALWCQIRMTGTDARKQRAEFSDPSETARKLLTTYDLEDVCITRISPLAMGGRPVHTATLLLSGQSFERLKTAQRILSRPPTDDC